MAAKIHDLNTGLAMVVTDLHGAWDAYRRLRDLFLTERAKGVVDYLVVCGDLIHSEGTEETDSSLEMLLDVMALQSEVGKDRMIMLLGNHELPHIYGLTLAKGSIEYTPRFEAALTRLDQRYKSSYKRKDVIDFLSELPFFARTKGGVLLTHAGAAGDIHSAKQAERLLNIDHLQLIQTADAELKKYDVGSLQRGYAHFLGSSYDEQVKHYLAVSGVDDPRYNHLLRVLFLSGQNTDFDLMWNTLFSQNELEVGEGVYLRSLKTFLESFSALSPHELRVLVAGHVSVKDGYAEVGRQQLRLASHTHAFPRRSARYLLLDCEKEIKAAADLIPGLRFVNENDMSLANRPPVALAPVSLTEPKSVALEPTSPPSPA